MGDPRPGGAVLGVRPLNPASGQGRTCLSLAFACLAVKLSSGLAGRQPGAVDTLLPALGLSGPKHGALSQRGKASLWGGSLLGPELTPHTFLRVSSSVAPACFSAGCHQDHVLPWSSLNQPRKHHPPGLRSKARASRDGSRQLQPMTPGRILPREGLHFPYLPCVCPEVGSGGGGEFCPLGWGPCWA